MPQGTANGDNLVSPRLATWTQAECEIQVDTFKSEEMRDLA